METVKTQTQQPMMNPKQQPDSLPDSNDALLPWRPGSHAADLLDGIVSYRGGPPGF